MIESKWYIFKYRQWYSLFKMQSNWYIMMICWVTGGWTFYAVFCLMNNEKCCVLLMLGCGSMKAACPVSGSTTSVLSLHPSPPNWPLWHNETTLKKMRIITTGMKISLQRFMHWLPLLEKICASLVLDWQMYRLALSRQDGRTQSRATQ